MIFVIEGADGTGKSTLADALAKKVNGVVIHSTFNSSWNIFAYHMSTMRYALSLSKSGINVVLDRWAPSEYVYGTVFRNGPSYAVDRVLANYADKAVWIYCRNDNAVENHLKNVDTREEMFDDMTHVVSTFDEFISRSNLPWNVYDFDRVDLDTFISDITEG